MEKKDLRAGMRIVTQSGHSYVFMKGVVMFFDWTPTGVIPT